MAAQFFLKNIHPEMRNAASNLFGQPELLQSRANVFGELMRILISPTKDVEEAVNWVIGGGVDPDISLHMRMLTNRFATYNQFLDRGHLRLKDLAPVGWVGVGLNLRFGYSVFACACLHICLMIYD